MNNNIDNLTLNSPLFSVNLENISIYYIDYLEKEDKNKFIIRLNNDITKYIVGNDFKFFEEKYCKNRVYFNLKDAQEYQSEIRAKYIDNLYKEVQNAINNYNNAILKFFNKPLSNPLKKENDE